MNTRAGADNVLLTAAQIVEQFHGVSLGAVRRWIAAGVLKPVRREGRGRGGAMFFARGEVHSLCYAMCRTCGNGFIKTRLGQEFCSRLCRDRSRRLHQRQEP